MASLSPIQSSPTSGRQTLLSVVQDFASHDAFGERVHPLHPYSSDPETTIDMLKNLIDSTTNVADSLTAHFTLPLSNPKLLSLCKQQTALSYTVRAVSKICYICLNVSSLIGRPIKWCAKLWTCFENE